MEPFKAILKRHVTSQTGALISKSFAISEDDLVDIFLDSCSIRARMSGREVRCAVIFIGSCCAIMISYHHHSYTQAMRTVSRN